MKRRPNDTVDPQKRDKKRKNPVSNYSHFVRIYGLSDV